MKDEFPEWIRQEAASRGWSLRELAKRAKVSPGALNQVVNQGFGAGPGFCTSIANALAIPPDVVFRKAGLLPDIPSDELQEFASYLSVLSKDDVAMLLRMVRTMARQNADEKSKEP